MRYVVLVLLTIVVVLGGAYLILALAFLAIDAISNRE